MTDEVLATLDSQRRWWTAGELARRLDVDLDTVHAALLELQATGRVDTIVDVHAMTEPRYGINLKEKS